MATHQDGTERTIATTPPMSNEQARSLLASHRVNYSASLDEDVYEALKVAIAALGSDELREAKARCWDILHDRGSECECPTGGACAFCRDYARAEAALRALEQKAGGK